MHKYMKHDDISTMYGFLFIYLMELYIYIYIYWNIKSNKLLKQYKGAYLNSIVNFN